MRPSASSRGFTLVELLISMALGTIIMLAVFSSYLYLGRNLTRLSYKGILEVQSRKILTTLASDIRNTQRIIYDSTNGSPSSSALTLIVYNTDPSKGNTDCSAGNVPTFTVTYIYDPIGKTLSRNPDAAGAGVPVTLVSAIQDPACQVPVTMESFSFYYYTTSGNTATPLPSSPMSIKQVGVSFALQAGSGGIQGQQGTLTGYQIASGQMLLSNRQLPDGS